ncbi:MAG: hypothetical protein ACLUJG_10825 [Lawsonibacter sp.]
MLAIGEMTTMVLRATSTLFFPLIFRVEELYRQVLGSRGGAASSWESAVDMVAARIPAKIAPARRAEPGTP